MNCYGDDIVQCSVVFSYCAHCYISLKTFFAIVVTCWLACKSNFDLQVQTVRSNLNMFWQYRIPFWLCKLPSSVVKIPKFLAIFFSFYSLHRYSFLFVKECDELAEKMCLYSREIVVRGSGYLPDLLNSTSFFADARLTMYLTSLREQLSLVNSQRMVKYR